MLSAYHIPKYAPILRVCAAPVASTAPPPPPLLVTTDISAVGRGGGDVFMAQFRAPCSPSTGDFIEERISLDCMGKPNAPLPSRKERTTTAFQRGAMSRGARG